MFQYYFTLCGCKKIGHFSRFCSDSYVTANRQILSDLLGISINKAIIYINKYKLHHKDSDLLAQNIRLCQSLGYKEREILNTRNLLTIHPTELEQHYKALEEGGFNNITPHVLAKSRSYMKKMVKYLKFNRLIPMSTNVPETLVSFIEDKDIAEKIEKNFQDEHVWKLIHLDILQNFLRLKLDGTEEEIANLIKIHRFVKNKSFRVIQKNIRIAESLGFTPKKLIKYGYLLANNPTNVETTLRDLSNIAGIDMKVQMRRHPKLIITPPRNILKIYGILKQFEIPDEIIRNQPNVFVMAPETVKLRLQEIKNTPDLKMMIFHPKILRLVVHHNRAKTRLTFLQESKIRCASLTILNTDYNNHFEHYIKEGKDINKKSDLLHYLAKLFSVSRNEIKSKITRHSFYLYVPLKDMDETYKYLITNRFSKDNIFKTIYILLYPVSKVRNSHLEIKSDVKYKYKSLSQVQKLNLILYLMEKEHHFTGNGIWMDSNRVSEFEENGVQ